MGLILSGVCSVEQTFCSVYKSLSNTLSQVFSFLHSLSSIHLGLIFRGVRSNKVSALSIFYESSSTTFQVSLGEKILL